MPWSFPIPLLTENLVFFNAFVTAEVDLNLHTFFGSPSKISTVTVTFQAFIRTMLVGPWAAGSVINITGLSEIQFLGRSGQGGGGAESWVEGLLMPPGCLGIVAGPGFVGAAAITLPGTAVTVNYDGDVCSAWGGGGGGGGGGYNLAGPCESGSGGGGGQGWATVGGGTGGFGCPSGGSGGQSGPGSGGAGGGGCNAGGDGSNWGFQGETGTSGGSGGAGTGGIGGRAIAVPAADTFNIVGAKNEATLISESRLIGRSGSPIGPA